AGRLRRRSRLIPFANASRNPPVPSRTTTFFSPIPRAIITPGRMITPAISTGKKSVMKMNIFLRTAARYSRFRTASVFLMHRHLNSVIESAALDSIRSNVTVLAAGPAASRLVDRGIDFDAVYDQHMPLMIGVAIDRFHIAEADA